MPIITVNTDVDVDVDIDLVDFDTEDMIEEIERRGYVVCNTNEKKVSHTSSADMEEVIWRYTRGYIEDAMILLERLYPDLYGLHKRIK